LAYFQRSEAEEDSPSEQLELERGRRLDSRAMNQTFRSILSLRAHSEQGERALRASIDLTLEMQTICREHSVRMLCLYIPSPTEAEWKEHADVFDRFRSEFSLSDEDLRKESWMADQFLASIHGAGVETLDAREVLVQGGGPYFWKGEYHLDLRGHRAIAEALRTRIAQWKDFPAPRRPR
jgi:hypothetical protein